jgi:hypothetical protein
VVAQALGRAAGKPLQRQAIAPDRRANWTSRAHHVSDMRPIAFPALPNRALRKKPKAYSALVSFDAPFFSVSSAMRWISRLTRSFIFKAVVIKASAYKPIATPRLAALILILL